MQSEEAVLGYEKAPSLDFGVVQLDPRAEDVLRGEITQLGLDNDDTVEVIHNYLMPYIASLEKVAAELEEVEIVQRSLNRKRGAVRRSVIMRMDDFVALETAMHRIHKAAHVCEGDPLALIQALMIVGRSR